MFFRAVRWISRTILWLLATKCSLSQFSLYLEAMLKMVSTSASISDSFSISRKDRICFCISVISPSCCSMENKATAIIIVAGLMAATDLDVAVRGPADWSWASFEPPSAVFKAPQEFPFLAIFKVSPTAGLATRYKPEVLKLIVCVTVLRAGASEATPAPNVVSCAMGTLSVVALVSSARASARRLPVSLKRLLSPTEISPGASKFMISSTQLSPLFLALYRYI